MPDRRPHLELWAGDNRDVIPHLAHGSVDVVLTDPPYGLTTRRRHRLDAGREPGWDRGKFGGRAWDLDAGVEDPGWWAQLLPALTPGAVIVSFSAPRTWHRQVVAMRSAGLELRAVWAWCDANTYPSSINVADTLDRWSGPRPDVVRDVDWSEYGTGLKPVWTPILIAARTGARTPPLAQDKVFYHPKIQPAERVTGPDGVTHPTQKPLQLLGFIVDALNVPAGSHILDPYTGTGSTGVVAAMRGHRWTGIEICDGTSQRPDYVTLSSQRFTDIGLPHTIHQPPGCR